MRNIGLRFRKAIENAYTKTGSTGTRLSVQGYKATRLSVSRRESLTGVRECSSTYMYVNNNIAAIMLLIIYKTKQKLAYWETGSRGSCKALR